MNPKWGADLFKQRDGQKIILPPVLTQFKLFVLPVFPETITCGTSFHLILTKWHNTLLSTQTYSGILIDKFPLKALGHYEKFQINFLSWLYFQAFRGSLISHLPWEFWENNLYCWQNSWKSCFPRKNKAFWGREGGLEKIKKEYPKLAEYEINCKRYSFMR